MPKERKPQIPVNCTIEEKSEIQRLAKQQGRSVSNYMVWMALNGKVTDKE